MNYDLKHLGSMPPASRHPAYAGDVAAYLLAVVSIAANDGMPAAPPGTRAIDRAWGRYCPAPGRALPGVVKHAWAAYNAVATRAGAYTKVGP